MERRNFIRSLLAGLALAPIAGCLIDIPAEAAPPIQASNRGETYWRDALGLARPS